MASLMVTIAASVALICKIALCHFVAEFAFGAKLDLLLTLLVSKLSAYCML